MEFNQSHKQDFTRRLPFGISKVQFVSAQLGEWGDKEYIDVFFVDETGEVDGNVRLFFSTDKAIQFHFNTLKAILVHNTPEEKRDIARQKIGEVKNTEELVALLNDKLPGKEMWYTKYFHPTKTHEYQGRTIRDTQESIYGYEPKLREDLMPAKKPDQELINAENIQQTFPGAAEEKTVDITDDWS